MNKGRIFPAHCADAVDSQRIFMKQRVELELDAALVELLKAAAEAEGKKVEELSERMIFEGAKRLQKAES